MAAPSFERAITHVLKSEGGYVDHPQDPGGATNRGITLATLSIWRGRKVTKAEVKALTEAEAKAIYRKNYWDVVRGDALPAGLDLAVFDFGVNSGTQRAAKYLQGVVGVRQDGVIGPATLKAVTGRDTAETIRGLSRARLDFLSRLATWPVFGKGWRHRVLAVEQEALAMARTTAVPLPPPPDIAPIDPPSTQPASSGLFVALLKGIFNAFRSA